jgi:hypothetical protein
MTVIRPIGLLLAGALAEHVGGAGSTPRSGATRPPFCGFLWLPSVAPFATSS